MATSRASICFERVQSVLEFAGILTNIYMAAQTPRPCHQSLPSTTTGRHGHFLAAPKRAVSCAGVEVE